MAIWVTNTEPIELLPNTSEAELEIIIRAVYKHVLGNHYIYDSERLTTAESLLRDRSISVRGFVRAVGKSELYRRYFFEGTSAYRFIEMNFRNFLGRAPEGQADISEHVRIYNEAGYEAEIDSYIDSDEYINSFGENRVPYLRGSKSLTGVRNVGYNRTLALTGGNAANNSGAKARLITDLAADLPTKIVAPRGVGFGKASRDGRFRIRVTRANLGGQRRNPRSTTTYEVGYAQLSNKVQSIQRSGGKIVSISAV